MSGGMADRGDKPWGSSIEKPIVRRLESIESGKYRRETGQVLDNFCTWLYEERNVSELDEIEKLDCRRYAEHLRGRMRDDDDDLDKASTTQQYFDYVHAWLSWCVKDERLESNPARSDDVTEPLPQSTSKTSQQFWTARDRKAICATADAYVDRSFEDDDIDTDIAFRDRAFVYVLAFSGCRSAELLDHPDDPARNGITWADVDFESNTIEVFGKSREWEHALLLGDGPGPLKRLYQRTEYDEDEDPVFPRLDPVARANDEPIAMSTQAGRKALARLCEWSEYEFEETLLPHGARRGLGDELYSESAETAQEILRHQDIETTHDSYRERNPERLRDRAEGILDDGDES